MHNVVESTALSRAEWMARISISASDFESLVSSGVFRKDSRGDYEIKFVGLMVGRDDATLAWPKFWPAEKQTVANSGTLQAILNGYFRRSAARLSPPVELYDLLFRDDGAVTEFEIFLSLNSYYDKYGAYRRKAENLAESPFGAIDWPRTISNRQPIHGATGTVYLDPYRATFPRLANNVTSLQLSILNRLHEKYADSPLDGATEWEIAPLDDIRFESSVWMALLEWELAATFSEDDTNMLLCLKMFLERLAGATGPSVKLYGTNAFNLVWEDMCRVALVGPTKEPKPDYAFAVAKWYPRAGFGCSPSSEPRPDIVTRIGETLVLGDAKYYFPFPDAVCGWPDIAKQIMYELSYDSSSVKRVINALLFPHPGVDSVSYASVVRMAYGESKFANLPLVHAILINPFTLVAGYLKGEPYSALRDFLVRVSGP